MRQNVRRDRDKICVTVATISVTRCATRFVTHSRHVATKFATRCATIFATRCATIFATRISKLSRGDCSMERTFSLESRWSRGPANFIIIWSANFSSEGRLPSFPSLSVLCLSTPLSEYVEAVRKMSLTSRCTSRVARQ